MKLHYVLAAHNEEAALEGSIRRIQEFFGRSADVSQVEIVVGENASRDRTAEIARRLSGEKHRIPVRVVSTASAGLGHGLFLGAMDALERVRPSQDQGHFLLLTATDLPFGFTDWNAFQADLKAAGLEGCVRIGSKFHPESKVPYPKLRRVLSRGYAWVRKAILRSRVKDSQGTFLIRFDRARALLPEVRSRDFFFTTELTHLAECSGLGVREVPVALEPETRPTSVRFLKAAGAMFLQSLRLSFRKGTVDHRLGAVGAFVFSLGALLIYGSAYGLGRIWFTHTGWITHGMGDLNAHHLAWRFYREDAWHWPITFFDNWLYPVGSITVSTDSIPWVAAFFKLFRTVLPEQFQYFGAYHFACFFLLAAYARKLLLRVGLSEAQALLGGLFVMMSPPFLDRFGHVALCSQWVLLAALDVALRSALSGDAYPLKKRVKAALAWCVFALGVHPYLWSMVFPVFACSFFTGRSGGRRSHSSALLALFALTAVSFAVMVVLGFFWFSSLGDIGFGYFHSDLSAFINPRTYSHVLPALSEAPGDYEGTAYLGLGGFALVAAGLLSWFSALRKRNRFMKSLIPLTVLLIALWIFSLGSNVAFLGKTWLTLDLYEYLGPIPGAFRASGRFIWLPFYSVVLAAWWCVCKARDRKLGWSLLVVATLAQFLDSSFLFPPGAHAYQKPAFSFVDSTPKISTARVLLRPHELDLLERWSKDIDVVVHYPDYGWAYRISRVWLEWSLEHGKKTQFGSASRLPGDRFARSMRQVGEELSSERLKPRTLYVLPPTLHFSSPSVECAPISSWVVCRLRP